MSNPPDIVQQLRAGFMLEQLAVQAPNPILLDAIEDAANEIERLREEVQTWKDRYEAERQDHEATIKAWDEEQSSQ